jgi:hypothetical protein
MRIPGWHRRLHSGAGGDIEANQKCKNALHRGSAGNTRPIIAKVATASSWIVQIWLSYPTFIRYSHSRSMSA